MVISLYGHGIGAKHQNQDEQEGRDKYGDVSRTAAGRAWPDPNVFMPTNEIMKEVYYANYCAFGEELSAVLADVNSIPANRSRP